jgi:hypothetical protein
MGSDMTEKRARKRRADYRLNLQMIAVALRANPTASDAELAKATNLSVWTVKKSIGVLRDRLQLPSPRHGGHASLPHDAKKRRRKIERIRALADEVLADL